MSLHIPSATDKQLREDLMTAILDGDQITQTVITIELTARRTAEIQAEQNVRRAAGLYPDNTPLDAPCNHDWVTVRAGRWCKKCSKLERQATQEK